jgi:hypothetical protein
MPRQAARLAQGAAALVVAMLLATVQAEAAYQTCAEKFVSMDIVRCPDGSVPHYNTGNPPGAASSPTASKPGGAEASPLDHLFGIWHTNRPGASYASALDVPGAYLLAARPGLAQGDLTISPNGTYVWNSFSGTSGRWVRSETKGLTLYDEPHHTKWLVVPTAETILISDPKQSFSGRR